MLNAVLIIDKPAGFTSHDVVNRLRRITGERSIGHLGTLDPMATGVLPMVIGRYTRLAQFFTDARKTYEGEIRLGFATTTYDAEGDPVAPAGETSAEGEATAASGEVPKQPARDLLTPGVPAKTLPARPLPTLDELRAYLPKLTGRILQRPPDFSAKKIKGVPAYKLARREQPVELQPVEVEVHRFELTSMEGDLVHFIAEVSAGTYVRSLAHDLGQALGCGAHLATLRRTASGEFSIADAITIEKLADYTEKLKQSLRLAPVVSTLSESTLSDFANEQAVPGEVNGNVADSPSPLTSARTSAPLATPPGDQTGAPAANAQEPSSPYLHPRRILASMPSVTVTLEVAAAIRNGRPVNLPDFSTAPLVKVFANRDLLLAVAQRIAGTLFQPKVVLYGSNEPLPD
jgi:tRNA pseudouridine55 synthase